MSHSAENCFGKRSEHKSIRDGPGGPMGSRDEAVKRYKRSKSKRKKELKALEKRNKIRYSIAKKLGSRREIENIETIKAKASEKRRDDIRNSSGDESDSDYSLSRYRN